MSLTCISCEVVFASAELQRDHYKNDWHRYNLKRKIAELPPVTKEEFDIRAAAHSQAVPEEDDALTCGTCHKKFVSNNSRMNHMKSKKHLENELRIKPRNANKKPLIHSLPRLADDVEEMEVCEDEDDEDDGSDWESIGDPDDSSIPPNFCLFCSLEHKSVEDSVKHMTEVHSFFIPDIEYLVDLKGLITYLGYKIGCGRTCLWCDKKGKSFHSIRSVQQHMLDKGHCKLLHEGEAMLGYMDFYDYSSSYPDATDDNMEDEIPLETLEADGFELVLPSGAVIGHRSLAVYYKQNLPPKRNPGSQAISSVVQHYRALGWTGTTGEAAVRKAKDLKFLQQMRNKYYLKLGQKQNKFQPHFRPQVLF